MSLNKCKECGNDVSNQAKTCPHCGAKVKKSKWGIVIFVIIFSLIVGACLIFTPLRYQWNGYMCYLGRDYERYMIPALSLNPVTGRVENYSKKVEIELNVRESLNEEYGSQCVSIKLLEGTDGIFSGTAKLEDGREIDIEDVKIDGEKIGFKHSIKQGYEYKCKHHINQLKFYLSTGSKERGVLFGEIWNDNSEPVRGFIVAEFIDDQGRIYHRDREIVFYSGNWWMPPGKNSIFAFMMPEETLKESAVNAKIEFFNLGNDPLASYVGETMSDKSVLESIPVKVTSQIYKIQKENPSSKTWQDNLPLRFRLELD